MQACGSSLTALAIRFAEELRTHFVDVMERLEELWMIARNNEAMYTVRFLISSLCYHFGTSRIFLLVLRYSISISLLMMNCAILNLIT